VIAAPGPAPATATQRAPDWRGKLELLVLQPTPFCNLDCDYCYLPHRDDTRRMDLGTLDAAAWKIFTGGLPAPRMSIVWHAGEPTAVPVRWYEEAFARLAPYRSPAIAVSHHFQTNGVLLDSQWCEFIGKHAVHVGVSLDGPAHLHDRHRRTRDGRGTHARVMRGIGALRDAGIPFHVICVLTRDSLAHADEIFDFFADVAPTCLCFNIEEAEGDHRRSSLTGSDADAAAIERAFRAFLSRIVERMRGESPPFRVREVDSVLAALRHPDYGHLDANSQNEAGRIVSIAFDGRFTTFSPELLGASHPRHGDTCLGNVLSDPLPPDDPTTAYRAQNAEIARGIARCRDECKYFDFCMGGAPSNKLGEHGRYDVTETMFCRLTQKAVVDVVLDALDRDLAPKQATEIPHLLWTR
jgi:uncharacterized protein